MSSSPMVGYLLKLDSYFCILKMLSSASSMRGMFSYFFSSSLWKVLCTLRLDTLILEGARLELELMLSEVSI